MPDFAAGVASNEVTPRDAIRWRSDVLDFFHEKFGRVGNFSFDIVLKVSLNIRILPKIYNMIVVLTRR